MSHAIPFPPCRTLLGLVLFLAAASTALAQIPGTLEVGDDFGHAVASGDFNGDGLQDLAVGVPGEDVTTGGSTFVDAGGVNLVYGTATGLDDAGSRFWGQSNTGVEDNPETADQFAYALAAGDFDGDGFSDLAIGVPFEDLGALTNAGVVNVLYGSASGITATGDQLWHQDVARVIGAAIAEERFGWSLAASDFNGDGFSDLAIGVPNEEIGVVDRAGGVNVLYGSAGIGLSPAENQFWSQENTGVLDNSETDDFFGWSVAAGDFDGDGFSDLAIGAFDEDLAAVTDAGAVNVLYGTSGVGLTATGDQLWHKDVAGVEDAAVSGDRFGWSVAAGDFDGSGADDLAIGGPTDDDTVGIRSTDSGAANVLYGSATVGLTATDDDFWHQSNGLLDVTEDFDLFASSLAAGDFDGDGFEDLAVGVPGEDVTFVDAGAVNTLYGSASGLAITDDQQFFYQGASFFASLEGEADEAPSTTPADAAAESAPSFALLPSSPNPFQGQATLRFALPEAGDVRLTVYDALGREVVVLVDEAREAGEHAVAFEAGALPSGAYLVRLEAAGRVLARQVTLVR